MEALVSTAVTVIAGSAILFAVGSGLLSTEGVREESIAKGIAEMLLDEIAGRRYAAPGTGPLQWPLGPESHEGPHRATFDDLDDFDGWASGVTDSSGIALGQGDGQGGLRHPNFRLRDGYFQNWRTEIDVFYVSDNDLSKPLTTGQTSYHRAVRVRVIANRKDGSTRQLATAQRVFSYVPAP